MKILPKKRYFGWKFSLWHFLGLNTLFVCGQLAAVPNTLASGEDLGSFESQYVLLVRKKRETPYLNQGNSL
jgi:hypothetical protein